MLYFYILGMHGKPLIHTQSTFHCWDSQHEPSGQCLYVPSLELKRTSNQFNKFSQADLQTHCTNCARQDLKLNSLCIPCTTRPSSVKHRRLSKDMSINVYEDYKQLRRRLKLVSPKIRNSQMAKIVLECCERIKPQGDQRVFSAKNRRRPQTAVTRTSSDSKEDVYENNYQRELMNAFQKDLSAPVNQHRRYQTFSEQILSRQEQRKQFGVYDNTGIVPTGKLKKKGICRKGGLRIGVRSKRNNDECVLLRLRLSDVLSECSQSQRCSLKVHKGLDAFESLTLKFKKQLATSSIRLRDALLSMQANQ